MVEGVELPKDVLVAAFGGPFGKHAGEKFEELLFPENPLGSVTDHSSEIVELCIGEGLPI